MINIWDYVDYNGKVKIVTVDRQEIVGKIYYVEDKDEGDSQDDCLNICQWNDFWYIPKRYFRN